MKHINLFFAAVSTNTLPVFSTTTLLFWLPNHQLNTAAALGYHDVREDAEERMRQLYNAGHSPMAAYHHFVEELKETEENFVTVLAGPKKMSNKSYFYRYKLNYVSLF